jgi:hypothetical protein
VEATATKGAIDDATEAIEKANEAMYYVQAPAPAAPDVDLFTFGKPQQQEQYVHNQPTGSYEQSPEPQQQPTYHSSEPSYGSVYKTASYEQSSSYEHPQPSYEQSQPSYEQPPYNSSEPDPWGNTSGSFGGVMGGAPLPAGSTPSSTVPLYASDATTTLSSVGMDEIGTLKRALKDAEDLARDAHDNCRALNAQADELRRMADEAEQQARAYRECMDKQDKKKKGLFRNKGKQYDYAEGEKLALDAKAKRDKVMGLQSQMKDAEALAADTKRAVDTLRSRIEDAEMNVASANSMEHQHQVKPSYSYTSPISASSTNGYGEGFDQSAMGYAAPAGSNPGVMSGEGGISIPTPMAGDADPYENPFK